jgi:hypothetical protein
MATIKISALTAYTTPLDADEMAVVDTANTTTKKVTWANIKAVLKTYFDTVYTTTGIGAVPTSRTINGNALTGNITLTATDLSLGNVNNTSDATKNSAPATLDNKRITKRIGTTTTSGSLTIDSDSYDLYTITALAETITINAPSGTPTNGQPLLIRIKDSGSAHPITWDPIFRVVGVTLPTTTVASKYNYVGCVYNSVDTNKWDVVTALQQV